MIVYDVIRAQNITGKRLHFARFKGLMNMKTISQVAQITGVSTRTLQYYDEIDLLRPSGLTPSGYRLYSDEALQKMQQILFFKELGFPLKDIKNILEDPKFDKANAFKKQKELLLLKRNRIDRLVELLGRLEKGDECMSFKEFDLTEYIEALECFKNNNTEDVIKHWGSVEIFDLFIHKIKEDEDNVAKLAIKEFGSIEKYTEAMKYNLEHFSENMEEKLSSETGEILQRNNELYTELTAHMEKDVSSPEVQRIVHDIITYAQEHLHTSEVGDDYWDMIIDTYSRDFVKAVTDAKYGSGAAEYIAQALHYYFHGAC